MCARGFPLFRYILSVLFIILLMGQSAWRAAWAAGSASFSQGRTHLSVYGGTGYAFNDRYTVIGVSGSYFILDGLNIGLAYENWSGGNPDISKLTPSMVYVFTNTTAINPYVGVFYRRTYIENLEDLESTGARAGIYFNTGGNAYFGVGGVYESYLNCNESVYVSCDDTYPEVSFVIAF